VSFGWGKVCDRTQTKVLRELRRATRQKTGARPKKSGDRGAKKRNLNEKRWKGRGLREKKEPLIPPAETRRDLLKKKSSILGSEEKISVGMKGEQKKKRASRKMYLREIAA